jgi:hypothetical protein
MSNKKAELYKEIFDFFKKKCCINPSSVMCDFEKGMRKGVKKVWRLCELKDCYFHYAQASRRKAKSLMKGYLCSNKKVIKITRMFIRLPLLPQNKIIQGFEKIKKFQAKEEIQEIFKEFNEYFEKNWLNAIKSCGNEEYRTNNICENFNSKLKRKIQRNPSCLRFLSM